ncbi:MAG: hypothetical protein IPL39_12330 [Opitutaceae bacterium]|nr:hypothetical protein [Opitutaceae bacterium]
MNSLIKISAEEGRDLFFLHPDSFYPDGYFGKIVAQARKGKRLIFSAGVRVDAAKMDAMFPEQGRPISRVSKQAFEALTIANLHEFVRRQYWDSETLSYWPSGLLCRLDRNVTVARFFDMHPIYVALSEGRGPIKKNVDTDYDSDIMARMLERGAGDTIEVLKGENSYFASLTATDEPWATRLTLVGDDPNAPLDSLTFPRSDTEKFLHVAKWAAKYVPLKKILCFQPLYVFRTESGRHQFPAQRALEFSALCDSLVAYFPLLQTEVRPRFSLELPHLNVQIDA